MTDVLESRIPSLKVAWTEGDEVLKAVQKAQKSGDDFMSLTNGLYLMRSFPSIGLLIVRQDER